MKYIYFFVLSLIVLNSYSQKTIPEVLKQFNTNSVNYITVNELNDKKEIILLDAREESEFNVSHIRNAQYVGFEKFEAKKIKQKLTNFNATIVVYCSLGIRSEKIGKKLLKLGYKNVYNLYGGIFEWKNQSLPVFDSQNKETENVHAFSKEWSQYLTKGNKIY